MSRRSLIGDRGEGRWEGCGEEEIEGNLGYCLLVGLIKQRPFNFVTNLSWNGLGI